MRIYSRRSYFLLWAGLGLVLFATAPRTGAQSHPPPRLLVEPISDEGVDSGVSYFTALNFEKGSGILNAKDLKALTEFMDRSLHAGEVKNVMVLGFSDQPIGGEMNFRLLRIRSQKKLVDQRNESVQFFLKRNYPQLNIQLVNMVMHPTAVEEIANKSDLNLRKTFEDAGVMLGNSLNSCTPKIVAKVLVVSSISSKRKF